MRVETDVPEVALPDRLTAFLLHHPFYSYKDLLEEVFGEDEDHFIDAWCSGVLPPQIRRACEDTMTERTMEILLLRRVVRQLGLLTEGVADMAAALREGGVSVFDAPPQV